MGGMLNGLMHREGLFDTVNKVSDDIDLGSEVEADFTFLEQPCSDNTFLQGFWKVILGVIVPVLFGAFEGSLVRIVQNLS